MTERTDLRLCHERLNDKQTPPSPAAIVRCCRSLGTVEKDGNYLTDPVDTIIGLTFAVIRRIGIS